MTTATKERTAPAATGTALRTPMVANTPTEVSRLLSQSSTRQGKRVKRPAPSPWTPAITHVGPPGGFSCPSQTYEAAVLYEGHVCGPWCPHDEDGGAEWCECPSRVHRGSTCKHIALTRQQFTAEWAAEQARIAAEERRQEWERAAPVRRLMQAGADAIDREALGYRAVALSPARAATARLEADHEGPVWGPSHD